MRTTPAHVAHDAHHLPSPGPLARAGRQPGARAGRSVDWLRVGVWAATALGSFAVWGGIGLAIAALVH